MLDILAAFATVAPEMFAAEAAAATAAEIAAAEAAAAAAAEAAAATAAQQAAATTAAEAAATTAAQQAAMSGAPQAAGIMEVGGAAANAPLTAEAVNAAAQQANAGIQGLQSQQPIFHNVGGEGFTQPITSPVSGINTVPDFQGVTSGPQGASPGFFNSTQAPGQGPLQYQLNAPNANQGMRLDSSLGSMTAPTTPMTSVLPPPSALEVGMDKAVKFAKANPFTAMTGAYMGANALGLMDPSGATFNDEKYDGPLSRYRLSPDFKPGGANPADFQYTPRQYATGGGIMGDDPYTIPVGYPETNDVPGYAKGGSLSDSITQYQKMLDGKPQAAPARSADVGIYYDQDPDTRYQDALTAAQIRQAKVNQRAYVSPPAAKRPTPMGQLQMASVKPKKRGEDVEAARGGIMQSYASGGITGDGNLNLQIPLNLGGDGGGGGGGGFGGYTPAGGGNVNPNTGGGGFGGFGGGQPQGGFGGLMQGIAGLFGAGQTPRMDDMDMYSHGPREFMEVPDAQNYQDVIRGRGDMLSGMGGTAQNGYMSPGGMGGYNPFTGRLPEFNPIDNRLHGGMGQGGQYMGFAQGGITSLGGYAAGGNPRLLKGPGDGMSDNIPATINGRQPARLADGEFVIPADVVSHLGNGSTEAGAKQLHAMMDRVRKARTGNKKQGKQIVAAKYLPKKKSA
jgi:hypothetical protein